MVSALFKIGADRRSSFLGDRCLLICAALLLMMAHPAESREERGEMGRVGEEIWRLSGQVEVLRVYVGVPGPDPPHVRLHHASLSDLYFEARALFFKINRLSFEILRRQEALPPIPENKVGAGDILAMIKPANLSLERIAFELHADTGQHRLDTVRPESTSNKDMFLAILAISHQINALFEHHNSDTDAYVQVTLAVRYAARLLAAFPQARRIPAETPFEAAKQPKDVFGRLLHCLALIKTVDSYPGSEVDNADSIVERTQVEGGTITSADVFDLAVLVVARLEALCRRQGHGSLPRQSLFPGRRFPVDVFQRAGLLEKQLELLYLLSKGRGPAH